MTCSVQSTFTTGLLPRDHGIVANGWYFRDLARGVAVAAVEPPGRGREDLGDRASGAIRRSPVRKLFWWYNMYSSADLSVTPRPQYPADGRKLPDVYTHPAGLRDELQERLGTFPLFNFWGPRADIELSGLDRQGRRCMCSRRQRPTLTLVYLPHLDYNLQRLGPNHPDIAKDVRAVDAVVRGADRALRERGGRRGDRALGVRHHRGERAPCTSTAPCARRAC